MIKYIIFTVSFVIIGWGQNCYGDEDCADGYACISPTGDCNFITIAGECIEQDGECTGDFNPVCGCDGVTYSNECYAHREGTGIAYGGECEPDPQIGDECLISDEELGYYNCYLQCYPIWYLENGLGDGICDDFWGSAELFCPEFGYDCGDCNPDWDGSDPLEFCEEDYDGPTWHISTDGSDDTGDGSADNPFASIQYGIDMSAEGDTVLVAVGMYFENIIWPATNGIKLMGSGQNNCIIE